MKRFRLLFTLAALLMFACSNENPVGVDSATEPGGGAINEGPPAPKYVPFKATWTIFPVEAPAIECSVNDPGWVTNGIGGTGEATHLGPATFVARAAFDPDFLEPGQPIPQTGCIVMTADNGDELFVEFTGTFTPTPTSVTASGTTEFVGGTGRFRNATGTGTYESNQDLILGTAVLTQVGTISMPGRRRPDGQR